MNPEKAAKFREKAEKFFDKQEYERALDAITKSLEFHPENPRSWQLQGFIL
jgi:regulator of sirC expression with transglutaminase-like and TPR domain